MAAAGAFDFCLWRRSIASRVTSATPWTSVSDLAEQHEVAFRSVTES